MSSKSVEIYDTTLRDGSQAEGISYSVQDKVLIAKRLDEAGIPFVEGGWPGANPKDIAFFDAIKKIKLKQAKIVAFGSTRKAHTKASEDPMLKGLLAADTDVITIFGKSWDMHVKEVFKVELEENIAMIDDTVRFLISKGKVVIYDAEHFFDGYKHNPAYALKTIQTAASAGARTIVLCDTNGGALPWEITRIVGEVKAKVSKPLGLHVHNDGALGVANSLAGIEAGARHVQGTINGFGERCGNADLIPIIANLQLKMGYSCLPEDKIAGLTELSRFVADVSNLSVSSGHPYVGQSAFAHKGGIHINAVLKNPVTYEHVEPSVVGNRRRHLVSEVGGRTNIAVRAEELGIDLKKESPETKKILEEVQKRENEGYQYEAAEASLELLIRHVMGKGKTFFKVKSAEIASEIISENDPEATAKVVLDVAGKSKEVKAKGDGPVDALGRAFKEALSHFYPEVKDIRLDDYKVRIVDSKSGSAARVRVVIEFRQDAEVWTTVGVSTNIIEASWLALVDAYEYRLMKLHGSK